mmetsp:Transcript_14214/g.34190  ORF Transcript_14214/g.34190 Transcript_14214/m.34190 type:complete len:255 (-) Transcript_14214:861-1625(-)
MPQSTRQICSEWNPTLGAIGYAPPTFKRLMRDMGVNPVDAREVQESLKAITRAGAKELWETRNTVQLQIEKELGITAADKRDKVKRAEYAAAHKKLTGKQKAAIREATSPGKSPRDPIRDGLGRVVARYCSEIGCEAKTSTTGRFCTNCDATLPSRKRTAWDPETRTPTEQWGEESLYLYWKTRLMAKLRTGGALETINEVLGWFLKKEEKELMVKNLYLDVTSSQSNNGRARRSETNQANLQEVRKAAPVKRA